MKKQVLVALLATALALPLAAQAEGYFGFNAGQAETELNIEGFTFEDSDTAFKLYGGFGFTKNFGLEVGYVNFGKPALTLPGVIVTGKPTALYVAATGTLPLNEQFSLFAKAGVSANRIKVEFSNGDASEKHNNTAAMFGIGAAYNFTKNIAVVAEYENFGKVADEPDFDVKTTVVSVGVRYSF